jgi:prepilin-type N-terminal cleavage/methylation domain-containing protein
MPFHTPVCHTDQRGFTLIEIAIVMVIIGILAGSGISMVKVLTDRKARNASVEYLKQTRSSLINYLMNNGRLPWADSNGDGIENSGATAGNLPYLSLQTTPVDAYKRVLRYEVNANLTTNRASTCAALKTGLGTRPLVVDADGSTSAFAVAAILVSAGPMDADSNGNVFDGLNSGSHQGNNINGTPNYLRHPPLPGFDDLTTYIGGNELFGHACEYLSLAVNNSSGATVYVYNVSTGADLGSIPNNNSGLYAVISGTYIEIHSIAGGGGTIVASTPATPLVLAGKSTTVNLP